MQSNTEVLFVECTPELKAQVVALAMANDRTISAEVRRALRQVLGAPEQRDA